VTVTISPPIRIAAALGAIVAVALGLWLFLLGRSASMDDGSASPPVVHHVVPKPAPHATRTTAPKPKVTQFHTPASGFPQAVDRALARHPVVVVAVYLPGSSVDALVRKEARAAAIASHAGYVAISAANEQLAGELLAKTGVLPDPAVVVVKRPGTVATTFGVTDRDAVAQAVALARR
jgi:hypothetical protein